MAHLNIDYTWNVVERWKNDDDFRLELKNWKADFKLQKTHRKVSAMEDRACALIESMIERLE